MPSDPAPDATSVQSVHSRGQPSVQSKPAEDDRKNQLLPGTGSDVEVRSLVSDGRDVKRGSSKIFLLLMVTNVMVNFDSGGTAAVLVLLDWGCTSKDTPSTESSAKVWVGPKCQAHEEDDKDQDDGEPPRPDVDPKYFPCMNDGEKGVLGGCPYLGLSFGCPIIGYLLSHCSQKKVVLVFLLANVVATFIFAYVISTYYLYAAKFTIGFTQGALCIYSPVWVQALAPLRSKTLWLGLMQGASAIGAMVGYAVAGYIKAADNEYWQYAFKIQAFVLATCCVILALVPSDQIDTSAEDVPSAVDAPAEDVVPTRRSTRAISNMSFVASFAGQAEPMQRTLRTSGNSETLPHPNLDSSSMSSGTAPGCFEVLREVLCNRVFLLSSFTLCALFFVVTGVQFWASVFFSVSYGRTDIDVATTFVAVAGTGPILGVVFGSALYDKYTAPEEDTDDSLPLTEIQEIGILKIGTRICTMWGFIASVAGIGAALIPPVICGEDGADLAFYSAVACIWFQLVFGGAMLPAVTGINLSSVQLKYRTIASSTNMLMYNILGYMMGSYLPGQIADWIGRCDEVGDNCQVIKPIRMRWAMGVVLFSAFWAVVFMGCAKLVVDQKYRSLTRGESRRHTQANGDSIAGTELPTLEPYPKK